jgi:hypothetical protein
LPPKRERALVATADALSELAPHEWDRLCHEEAAALVSAHQYFEAFGYPDSFPPALTLGSVIIRHYVARYPALAQDVAGTA